MLEFLRTRQWIVARRTVLVGIVLIVAYRSYGDAIVSRLRGPNGQRDITITHAEFRPELPGAKPAWIIGLRNNSNRFTYDQIQLEATYADDKGSVLEKDKPVVKQKIQPLAQISHRFPEPTAGHYVVAGFSPRSHNETRDTLS